MGRALGTLVLILILAQIATAFLINDTILMDQDNNLKDVKTRRKDKSTSSSKESRGAKPGGGASESLDVVFTDPDSSSDVSVQKTTKKQKNRDPKSTVERKGWRKWHRKCTKCPEDMQKKWRDPSIKWICGAYQRARRSFKSLCMMHYRNCQDGTMFTKISEHRCPNGTKDGVHPYNHHFFYDYKVLLTDETSGSDKDTTKDSTSEESSSVSESELLKRIPPFRLTQR